MRQPVFETEEVRHGCPVPLPFRGRGNDDPSEANSEHRGGYDVRVEGARQNGANPAGLREQILEERIINLEAVLRIIPGFSPPSKRTARDLFNDWLFSEEISVVEIPTKFSFPTIRFYDGTQDPDEHMAHYKK